MIIKRFKPGDPAEYKMLSQLAAALDCTIQLDKPMFLYDDLGNWEFRSVNPRFHHTIVDADRDEVRKIINLLTITDKPLEEIIYAL
jgi:hypothetical protein